MKEEDTNVYDLFDEFIKKFFLDRESYIPGAEIEVRDKVLDIVSEKFLKSGIDDPDREFRDKMDEQLNYENGQHKARIIIAHAVWLWGLTALDIKRSSKVEDIYKILNKGEIEDEKAKQFNEIYPDKGIITGGQWHTQKKHREVRFILLIFDYIFRNNNVQKSEDIKELIEKVCLHQKYDYTIETEFTHQLPESKLASTNILLHLCKPKSYEPIAINSKKSKIIKAFKPLIEEKKYDLDELNDDVLILKIREVLETKSKIEKGFSFYDEEIRKLWDYTGLDKEFYEMDGLEYKKGIILYGPPGTSKTHDAYAMAKDLILKKRISNETIDELLGDNYEYEKHISKLQLHPSYNYEDFIAGMQLKNNETEAVKGKLFEICKKADNNTDLPYVLILDEINRVDLSRLFGEAFSAIENRGEPIEIGVLNKNGSDEKNESDENSLVIPENLYIIGTMNEIDFSLERIDFALRRRFVWYEKNYNENRLREIINQKAENSEIDFGDELDTFLENVTSLNEEIQKSESLGDQYQIGHTFFAEIVDIYIEYKKITGYTEQVQSRIYRDKKKNQEGPAQTLWNISIKPMLESFLGTSEASEMEEFEAAYFNNNA